ncbi:MAG: response regulator [Phycisphaeraceae bacterium]|nr:response regulator [Phycisphaeraceae bacterium]
MNRSRLPSFDQRDASGETLQAKGVHTSGRHFARMTLICAWIAIVIGAVALLGWMIDLPILQGTVVRGVAMRPNAAVGVILAGVALLLLRPEDASRVRLWAGRLIAGALVLLGLAVLSKHAVGWGMGIDQFLFAEETNSLTVAAGGVGIVSSLTFILFAIELLAIAESSRWMHTVAQYLALVGGAALLVPLVGYAYGVQLFYGVAKFTGVAANTTCALLALHIGLFFSRRDTGPAAVISSSFAGGVMARQFLIPALAGSLLIGWLCITGIRREHFEPAFGIALMLVSLLIIHGLLIRRTAAVLNSIDESFRRGEQRYRSLVEVSAQMVWTMDPQGGHIQVSAGNSPTRPAPTRLEALYDQVHVDDRRRVALVWQHSLRTGETYRAEYRLRQPDGQYRHMADTGIAVREADGVIREWIGVTTDITERKQAEESLRELSETLERRVQQRTAQLRALASELTQTEARERRRLAQVLHDHLQQLLVVAKMRMGLLRQQKPDADLAASLREVEEVITESIQASRSLTLELSPPILYDGGLAPALDWLARRMLDQHRLVVEVEISPEAEPLSEAVKTLLFQAVRELLFNTVKHAMVSEARVTMTREGSRIIILVEDAGAGFDPGSVASGDTLSDHYGLFSIRERLALMGGDMSISSSPGKGTRIQLSAPLSLPQSISSQGATLASIASPVVMPSAAPSTKNVIRVLLADDHRILREGIAGLLRGQPFIEVVGQAEDGQMALEMARVLRPDVVVMDVTMPRLNGIESTRAIKREIPGVQIIGLSMHEKEDMAAAMREAGAIAYLPKEGPSEALISAIRSCGRLSPTT